MGQVPKKRVADSVADMQVRSATEIPPLIGVLVWLFAQNRGIGSVKQIVRMAQFATGEDGFDADGVVNENIILEADVRVPAGITPKDDVLRVILRVRQDSYDGVIFHTDVRAWPGESEKGLVIHANVMVDEEIVLFDPPHPLDEPLVSEGKIMVNQDVFFGKRPIVDLDGASVMSVFLARS